MSSFKQKSSRAPLNWPTVVQRPTLRSGQRILAVSDIHGNLPFFQQLLKKVAFTPDDALFILGDILEKGEQSLALLRHIMQLCTTHQVYPLCGNCDGLVLRFFEGDQWDARFFVNYLPQHPECTLRQMADEIGFSDWHNLPALRCALRTHFAAEWRWLAALPTIIETERHIFVHAGVPQQDDFESLNAWTCMKYDDFLHQTDRFDKYVIVGHWPVTLYRPKFQSACPLISTKKKVVSIDGGCVLKLDGQLNALMIPDKDSDLFYWAAYDGLPTATALDEQQPSADPVNLRWGRSTVEVLSRGKEFCRCRHLETGRELDILTQFLHTDGVTIWCEDATDYMLPVSPGDVLSISVQTSNGVLAKKDGVTGWYFGRFDMPHDDNK